MVYKQFTQSLTLKELIKQITNSLSNSSDVTIFETMYLNLRTATGFGLDTIGAKIGIPRTITSKIFDDKEKIGYKGQNLGNMNYSNFATLSKTGTYTMGDDQYRFVLQLGHFSISTPCTIPGVNLFYKTFFPRTVVQENLMSITVQMYDEISTIENIILSRRDLLPIPMGVELKYEYNF